MEARARTLKTLGLGVLVACLTRGVGAQSSEPAPPRPATRTTLTAPRLFEGVRGGPFTPARERVELAAECAGAWTARASAPWLSVEPSSGVASATGALTLEIAPAEPALALAPGCHLASVEWRCGEAPPVVIHVALAVRQEGWTVLTPSADSRRVFVSSSSGDDFHDGFSERTAKRTLAAAIAQLRHGHPDWLLLKRGDTWSESLGHWKRSGRAFDEPMVVTSYGEGNARPKLLTGADNGLITLQAGDAPPRIDHVALVGLHMHADSYRGGASPSAVSWLTATDGLLIEDCYFEGFEVDIRISEAGGRKRNVRIRRNVIVDAFATEGVVGHGLYLAACDDLVLEENLIDRNGYNPAIEAAVPSMYRHGAYIQSGVDGCTDVLLRANIVAESASHGVQLRPGGIALDNLFLRNPIALLVGGGLEFQQGGVVAVAHRNVVLGGRDIDAANPRGWGLGGENLSAATFSENVIAFGGGGLPIPLGLGGDAQGVGVRHTWLRDNLVHDWGGSSIIAVAPGRFGPLWLERNLLSAAHSQSPLLDLRGDGALALLHARFNRFEGPGPAVMLGGEALTVDAWRRASGDEAPQATQALPQAPPPTIEAYMASLGQEGGLAGFLRAARRQSKAHWDPRFTAERVNAFVRAGFGR